MRTRTRVSPRTLVFAALAWSAFVLPAAGQDAGEARHEVAAEADALPMPSEGLPEVQETDPKAPNRFARWRASVFASGGFTGDWGASVATFGIGLYPWRRSGFELRWVGTSENPPNFSTEGLAVPGVEVHDEGARSIDGGGPELAAVARVGIFEPWASVGYWSGSARATVDGHATNPTACYWILPPIFGYCDYPEQSWSATRAVPSGATFGAGVRISPWDSGGLTFGVDVRRILSRPVRFDVVGVEAVPSRTFVTFMLGVALGGPSTRPAPSGGSASP